MSGKHPLVQAVENAQLKSDIPAFAPGDTVVVQVKVKEGDRERLQAFEGVVIAKKNRGLNSAFTVRKISSGVGVERVFQTHSPVVAKIATYVPCSAMPAPVTKRPNVLTLWSFSIPTA